ncbi:nitrate- and nitrite sensing domain-containing protein [Actinoplanes sp. NPDC051861]|uniref:sensor histidine kinase n=1 Tax=Actinoplanes sp. NPDC051861 TaxID=3155170 RepID=UPI003440C5D9
MKRGWRDVDPRLGAGLMLLVVLWLAATVPAVLGAAGRIQERSTADRLGSAVDATVVALQEERRLSAAALTAGDPAATPAAGDDTAGDPAPLAAARERTDLAGADLSSLTEGLRSHVYTAEAVDAARGLVSRLGTLDTIRGRVDDRTAESAELLAAYRAMIAAGLSMPELPGGSLARAREALSEEDALLRTALATRDGAGDAESLRVGSLAGERRAWLAAAPADLGTTVPALEAVEQRLLLAEGERVAPADWADVADPVSAALRDAQTRAVHDAVSAATPPAIGTTVWAGMIAGVGLVAVIGVLVAARRSAGAPAAATTREPESDAGQDRGLQPLLVDMHRRNQRLVHRLLRLLDGLERRQCEDETLEQLYRADHLATRVRRNVEKAITLSGGTPGRQWHQPMPLGEVVRGAAAEVDDYMRVSTAQIEPAALSGDAVLEVTHLLAELIDNAITYSPAETRVRTGGERDEDGGYTVTVTDAGPGMSDLDLENARQVMTDPEPPAGGLWSGFYAVGRFAARWEIDVRLARGAAGGLAAEVRIPADLMTEMSDTATTSVDLSVAAH